MENGAWCICMRNHILCAIIILATTAEIRLHSTLIQVCFSIRCKFDICHARSGGFTPLATLTISSCDPLLQHQVKNTSPHFLSIPFFYINEHKSVALPIHFHANVKHIQILSWALTIHARTNLGNSWEKQVSLRGTEGGEQSSCQVTRSQAQASLGKGTYKFSSVFVGSQIISKWMQGKGFCRFRQFTSEFIGIIAQAITAIKLPTKWKKKMGDKRLF